MIPAPVHILHVYIDVHYVRVYICTYRLPTATATATTTAATHSNASVCDITLAVHASGRYGLSTRTAVVKEAKTTTMSKMQQYTAEQLGG